VFLNNLAVVYNAQGKYADAEALYKRALAIYEKAHAANHLYVNGRRSAVPVRDKPLSTGSVQRMSGAIPCASK